MAGFIKIDRGILEWEWYQDPNTFRLFMHLLIIANHEPGNWRGRPVGRGQTITGRLKLSTALRLSEMQIRTALNKLKLTGEITVKTTNDFSLITICKYNDYQDKVKNNNQRKNRQSTSQPTNEQPTDNQRITTNKNEKNEKNNTTAEKADEVPVINLEVTGLDLVRKTATEVWKDVTWIEQLCMANGLKKSGGRFWMEQFNLSVSQDAIAGFNEAKYKKMFAGWVRMKVSSGQVAVKVTDTEATDKAYLKSIGL